jgi:hypothetical protein
VAHNTITDSNQSIYTVGCLAVHGAYSVVVGNTFRLPGGRCDNAIEVGEPAWHSEFANNVFTDIDNGNGIYLRLGVRYVKIVGNTFDRMSGHGILAGGSGSNWLTIKGNTITDCGLNGIFFNDRVRHSTIVGNIIEEVGDRGIDLFRCDHIQVVGNTIQNIGEAGVFIRSSGTPCNYIAVVGNSIRDVDNAGTASSNVSKANIGIDANQVGIVVANNVCEDTASGADNIYGTSIASGICIGNMTSQGVTFTGTTIQAANNI